MQNKSKLVDENKIDMRDDARFLTLLFFRAPGQYTLKKVLRRISYGAGRPLATSSLAVGRFAAKKAKRSSCGKSTRPGSKAHQTFPVNRLSVSGKGGKKIARRGKGKGKELLEHRLSSEMSLKER